MSSYCPYCGQQTVDPGLTNHSYIEGRLVVVIRNVPADVCSNCGEAYFDGATTDQLQAAIWQARASGEELSVREFPAPRAA
jgi:YgiT-type zinc finger domain-containing protein